MVNLISVWDDNRSKFYELDTEASNYISLKFDCIYYWSFLIRKWFKGERELND